MKKLGKSLVFSFVIFLLALIALTALPACKAAAATDSLAAINGENNSSEKVADSFTITYKGKEISVSMNELLQLKQVERDITPVPKEDEEKASRHVKGVLLEDIFQKYLGMSQKEPESLRLIAGDGYSIEVSSELLDTKEIILAYEVDGKPLEDWEKPLWSIVPDVFEMYWVKNLTEIEVVESRQEAKVVRIIMMETRISDISSQDYNYYEETAKAVKITDLLFVFNEDKKPDTVFIKAFDGLEKVEKADNFTESLIKFTGENAPMFLSDGLPKGMWVKDMMYFIYGGSAYFSIKTGFGYFDKKAVGGNESIKLTDLFKTCKITEAEKYLFKSLDDYTVEIEAGSIDKGYLYIQENSLPAVYFEGLLKNTKVKDLVYIGAVK